MSPRGYFGSAQTLDPLPFSIPNFSKKAPLLYHFRDQQKRKYLFPSFFAFYWGNWGLGETVTRTLWALRPYTVRSHPLTTYPGTLDCKCKDNGRIRKCWRYTVGSMKDLISSQRSRLSRNQHNRARKSQDLQSWTAILSYLGLFSTM